jgi:hypothetical protein
LLATVAETVDFVLVRKRGAIELYARKQGKFFIPSGRIGYGNDFLFSFVAVLNGFFDASAAELAGELGEIIGNIEKFGFAAAGFVA